MCEKALRVAITAIEDHIRKEFELDWPIQEQRKLFEIIGNTKDLIGVELTDSCLMLPIKSVSGIWFPAEHFENQSAL